MATNFTSFYDDVIPHMKGMPLALALHEIRAASIEFFARSLVHQVQLVAINSVNGTADYALASPLATTIIQEVLEVTYNGGSPLRFKRRLRDFNAAFGPTWATLSAAAPDYVYVNPQCTSLKLVKKPNASVAGAIVVLAAVKPTHAAVSLQDDDLYQQHRLAISEGAKSRLFAIPGRPWSNPEQGLLCAAKFEEFVKAARVRTMAGQGQSTGIAREVQK